MTAVEHVWVPPESDVTISKCTYTNDNLAHRKTMANSGAAFAAAAYTRWDYNARNELTDSDCYLGADPADWQTDTLVDDEQFSYTYDHIGNRTESVIGVQTAATSDDGSPGVRRQAHGLRAWGGVRSLVHR